MQSGADLTDQGWNFHLFWDFWQFPLEQFILLWPQISVILPWRYPTYKDFTTVLHLNGPYMKGYLMKKIQRSNRFQVLQTMAVINLFYRPCKFIKYKCIIINDIPFASWYFRLSTDCITLIIAFKVKFWQLNENLQNYLKNCIFSDHNFKSILF